MRSTRRVLSLLAGLALAVAVIVILVTPTILAAPNSLAAPSALMVAVGCGAALAGGRWGRRIGLAVSACGLILSGLWLLLASDGFGLGAGWVDDMVEAAILVALFLPAAALLGLSEGPITGLRVGLWVVLGLAITFVVLGTLRPVLPSSGPLPTPVPMPPASMLPAGAGR